MGKRSTVVLFVGLAIVGLLVMTGGIASRERTVSVVAAPPTTLAPIGETMSAAQLDSQLVAEHDRIEREAAEARAAEAARVEAERARQAEIEENARRAAAAAVTAAPPRQPAVVAPSGPSGCAYEALIRATFPEDGDYMVSVAIRESGCNPCAFYPGRSDCNAQPNTAKGLFQLLGHDGMIIAICGDVRLWSDPYCNAKVARALYDSSGRSPWRL